MSTHNSASVYHQFTALGASAVGQVVTLYDTILRDMHSALAAIEAGNIEKRINVSNHALVVVGELQGVLDFERGGEAARNLNNFYNVTRAMIVEASMTCSRDKLKEVIAMFTRLRVAWSQIERSVAPSEPMQRTQIASGPQTASFENAGVAVALAVESGSGDWRG